MNAMRGRISQSTELILTAVALLGQDDLTLALGRNIGPLALNLIDVLAGSQLIKRLTHCYPAAPVLLAKLVFRRQFCMIRPFASIDLADNVHL